MQHSILTLVCLSLTLPASAQSPAAASSVVARPTQPANPPAGGWQQFALNVVQLQPTSPGVAQIGHSNITGNSRAGAFQGDGGQLTGLNASAVTQGILPTSALHHSVAKLGTAQTFTASQVFSAPVAFTFGGGAPFSVSSATKVANLNCDTLDGLDSSAFLQSIPSPLVLNSNVSNAIEGSSSADYYGGVYGSSNAPSAGAGVIGQAVFGWGTYGSVGDGTGSVGYASNSGTGVEGGSASGHGVYGSSSSNGNGVRGESFSANSGVVGLNHWGGTGVEGHSTQGGNGVTGVADYPYAVGAGVYGEHNSGQYGVAGRSTVGTIFGSDVGVWGETYGASGWAMYSNGRMYVNGNFYAAGSKVGCVTDIVKNGGGEPLEAGDLVEIMGAEEPVLGALPLIVVRKATSANATGVLGPIASAIHVVDNPMKAPPASDTAPEGAGPALPRYQLIDIEGAIPVGGFGHVVTLGSFRTVKVDASFGPIAPGTLLVASPNPGYAAAALHPEVGTVIGKSLGSLSYGQGELPLIVHQQ